MEKKAYLVTFSIRTRVIAESREDAIEKAVDQILELPEEYIMSENVDTIKPDRECPLGTLSSDTEV